MSERRALAAAYLAARYLVLLDEGPLELRIGVRSQNAEARLAAATGGRHWAIVTPWNPRSLAIADEENQKLYRQMRGELEAMSQAWKPTLHRDPLGLWPDESGFLLIEPPPRRAAALGRLYRQNALVLLRSGSAPELQWLD
jgi:hypothetical protein